MNQRKAFAFDAAHLLAQWKVGDDQYQLTNEVIAINCLSSPIETPHSAPMIT